MMFSFDSFLVKIKMIFNEIIQKNLTSFNLMHEIIQKLFKTFIDNEKKLVGNNHDVSNLMYTSI